MADVPDIEIPMQILVAERETLQRWEYKIILGPGLVDLDDFLASLNQLGAEGWQVCQKLGESLLLIRQVLPETAEEEEARAQREHYADETEEESHARMEQRIAEMEDVKRQLQENVDEEPGE